MLQQRRRNKYLFEQAERCPCVYVLSDPSPQGHTNWLMSECFIVLAEDLPHIAHKVWRLITIGNVSWKNDHDEERVAEERGIVRWCHLSV
jgi:hypothetical protein